MNGIHMLAGAEHYVAVDNVCAWPNLTLLSNGEIAAAIYDKPSHGFGCGNVALWVSDDGGRLWKHRSNASDHADEPDVVRMNCAVGLNSRGEIVALVSGWSKGRALPHLDVQVCISGDEGRTWGRSHWDAPEAKGDVPFGNVVAEPDGTLTAALYGGGARQERVAFVYRSKDHGRTWGDPTHVTTNCGEPALLRCLSGSWLAAVNSKKHSPYEDSAHGLAYGDVLVTLFHSADEGRTWREGHPLTLPGQKPGNLIELRDGRVVFTYGSRIIGLSGVCVRISEDEGRTWSVARPLVTAPGPMDCGYPSTVELGDGTLVTAYYGGPREKGYGDPARGHGAWAHAPYSFPWHQRYHMGVCRWRPEMLGLPFDQMIGASRPTRLK